MMTSRLSWPAAVMLLWLILAIGATVLPLQPDLVRLEKILIAPEWQALLGYDELGRSIADRLIMGARTSLMVAISVVFISLLLGTLLGTVAAWLGGWWDRVIVLVIDTFIAFPGILLAIALAGLLGPGIMNTVIALVLTGWVGFARLARAQTLTIKQREHVQAARALGTGDVRIIRHHLLPLIMAPLLVEATFAISGTVVAEASLSFLGLGVQPPEASWGAMIREGTRYMLVAPHLVLAPGCAVFLVVISINLLGDRLRDKMDIRIK